MGERIARAKEVVGWATGDREVEAAGRVKKQADDRDQVTEEAVREETKAVRADHDDIDRDEGSGR